MTIRSVFFFLGCIATWVFVLPVLAVCGVVALVAYAVISQLGDFLLARGDKALDQKTAREIARRMCLGH
ncbi:MAG: hypothetical protein ABSH33_10580 [Steroidobacteraceae bacterium]|jgi:hypothetical protein